MKNLFLYGFTILLISANTQIGSTQPPRPEDEHRGERGNFSRNARPEKPENPTGIRVRTFHAERRTERFTMGPPPIGGFAMIIHNPLVIEYLDLEPKQIREFSELIHEVHEKVQARMKELTGGKPPHEWTPELMSSIHQELPKLIDETVEEITRRMPEVLSEEQITRAGKLVFSLSGGLDAPVLEIINLSILGLSQEQKIRIKAITDEVKKETLELIEQSRTSTTGTSPAVSSRILREAFEKAKKIRSEANEKIKTEVLTDQQREKAKEILEEEELKKTVEKIRKLRFDFRSPPRGPLGPPPGQGPPLGPPERQRIHGWDNAIIMSPKPSN